MLVLRNPSLAEMLTVIACEALVLSTAVPGKTSEVGVAVFVAMADAGITSARPIASRVNFKVRVKAASCLGCPPLVPRGCGFGARLYLHAPNPQ
jgi:hypothetical protein